MNFLLQSAVLEKFNQRAEGWSAVWKTPRGIAKIHRTQPTSVKWKTMKKYEKNEKPSAHQTKHRKTITKKWPHSPPHLKKRNTTNHPKRERKNATCSTPDAAAGGRITLRMVSSSKQKGSTLKKTKDSMSSKKGSWSNKTFLAWGKTKDNEATLCISSILVCCFGSLLSFQMVLTLMWCLCVCVSVLLVCWFWHVLAVSLSVKSSWLWCL